MTPVRNFAIVLSCFLFATAGLSDNKRIPAPAGAPCIEYEFFDDSESHIENTLRAKLIRDGKAVWSFDAKGRAIVFSWSPDSRYLLFGVVRAGRDMALYSLDARAADPQAIDLHLDVIEQQVEKTLPEQSKGSRAGRSQVNLEMVKWGPKGSCRLSYFYCFDHKAGNAELSLDLETGSPALKILSVTSVND